MHKIASRIFEGLDEFLILVIKFRVYSAASKINATYKIDGLVNNFEHVPF